MNFNRFIKKPPVLFPLVALFHIVMLGYSIWNYHTEPFPSIGWVQPLWMLCYTISWIFVCDMKRWAMYVYMGLTTLNLILRVYVTSPTLRSDFTDTLFPLDILFTFFLMVYYKRFE